MIQSHQTVAPILDSQANWAIDTIPSALDRIHEKGVNIAIYERSIDDGLSEEISKLLEGDVTVKSTGDIPHILNELSVALSAYGCDLIQKDIHEQLRQFHEITQSSKYRLLLGTVKTNLCRKFHTDVNDLRLLCTYAGPGTLWLSDDNVNGRGLNKQSDRDDVAIDESKARQAKTGGVIILKGALYPHEETQAVVHRSPSVEKSGEKRLLLRIDTNETINIWS